MPGAAKPIDPYDCAAALGAARDTGVNFDIDESANGSLDQTFSLWVALAPAGTYKLGTQNFGGNNYVVFGSLTLVKPVPEPASWALAAMGLVGLGVLRRRNQAS